MKNREHTFRLWIVSFVLGFTLLTLAHAGLGDSSSQNTDSAVVQSSVSESSSQSLAQDQLNSTEFFTVAETAKYWKTAFYIETETANIGVLENNPGLFATYFQLKNKTGEVVAKATEWSTSDGTLIEVKDARDRLIGKIEEKQIPYTRTSVYSLSNESGEPIAEGSRVTRESTTVLLKDLSDRPIAKLFKPQSRWQSLDSWQVDVLEPAQISPYFLVFIPGFISRADYRSYLVNRTFYTAEIQALTLTVSYFFSGLSWTSVGVSLFSTTVNYLMGFFREPPMTMTQSLFAALCESSDPRERALCKLGLRPDASEREIQFRIAQLGRQLNGGFGIPRDYRTLEVIKKILLPGQNVESERR